MVIRDGFAGFVRVVMSVDSNSPKTSWACPLAEACSGPMFVPP
jgi:hypothetical protein